MPGKKNKPFLPIFVKWRASFEKKFCITPITDNAHAEAMGCDGEAYKAFKAVAMRWVPETLRDHLRVGLAQQLQLAQNDRVLLRGSGKALVQCLRANPAITLHCLRIIVNNDLKLSACYGSGWYDFQLQASQAYVLCQRMGGRQCYVSQPQDQFLRDGKQAF